MRGLRVCHSSAYSLVVIPKRKYNIKFKIK
jgi:hypothetical protein